MHSKNITRIQNETLKILEETQTILPKTQELEALYKEVLNNEKLKLNHLEYVIAVVGTVKAGKSTTINAIVGKEVLPHRTEAMTTLPTLITHALGQIEPILKLPKIEPLKMLLTAIKQKLHEDIKSNFLKTDEGKEFIQNTIKSDFAFLATYQGEKRIFEFLKTLNDMMRAAKELDLQPPFKEFENVDQLPRIEVEFKYLKDQEAISHAKLSLLDTPGTNEYQHSEYLNEILTAQLKKASSVVLVINYPQISSQESGELRERFSQTVDFVGKENMFVFGNQLDNVKKDEADPEKIKHNIAENKLDGNISKDHVFPISAKRAFFAQLGLIELEKNKTLDLLLPWIEDFGETVIGPRWKKYIDDREEVKEACHEVWKDSLFETPLKAVIANAHVKASLHSIKGTLNKLAQITNELQNSFKVQENALSETIEKLKHDIETLKNDIEKMKEISQHLTHEVDTHLKEIKSELNALLEHELNNASHTIMAIFDQQEDKLLLENKEKDKKVNLYNNNFFASLLRQKSETFPERIKELKESGTLKFYSKEDAHEFKSSIVEISQQHTLNIIEAIEQKFAEKSGVLIENINHLINSNLGDLLNAIKTNLGTNINLEFPHIVFKTNDLNVKRGFDGIIHTESEQRSRKVEADYFGSSITRAIDFFDYEWGYEREDYTEENISIRKNDLEKALHALFEKISKSVQENSHTIYTNTISVEAKKLLDNLIFEIENYRAEKLTIAEKRKADAIDTQKEIMLARLLQAITVRLQKRVETVQSILKETSRA
ncbi:dynamin family protein [Sulfurospirillum cavolei]|uniref:dynamin family protein n=1 Tax=Sulfurospirillum cavolei TaxID=366522 RepID=UPI000764A15F|nr:dynamin family protein [Sulfurospirillum cavolei]